MSPRIGCSTAGRGEWGSLGQYRGCLPARGGGRSLRNGLFPQVGCGSCGEVGVPSRRCRVGLKKKGMGLGLLARGPGCGVAGPSE
jgi:hypothetical protein